MWLFSNPLEDRTRTNRLKEYRVGVEKEIWNTKEIVKVILNNPRSVSLEEYLVMHPVC